MGKAQTSGFSGPGRPRKNPVVGWTLCIIFTVPVTILILSLINFPSTSTEEPGKIAKKMGDQLTSESLDEIPVAEDEEDVRSPIRSAKKGSAKDERGLAAEDDAEEDGGETVSSRKGKERLRVFVYDLPAEFNWNISRDRKAPVNDTRDLEFDPRDFSRRRLRSLAVPREGDVASVEIDQEAEALPRHHRRRLLGHIDSISFDDIPVYEGGPQTRSHSVEYWLTLALLHGVPSAVRVKDPSEAEVFFVPFFSSISFNRYMEKKPSNKDDPIGPKDRALQERVVKLLKDGRPWKRSDGRDHVIMAHHPKALIAAAPELRNAIFIVSDFQQFPLEVSNVTKDVVAPYKSPLIPFDNDKGGWDARPTLIFFMGSVKRHKGGWVRQRLNTLLPGLKDCVFEDRRPSWTSVGTALQGMRKSKFCLVPAGDTPSSARLFDAILSHCVPIIISDFLELPYEDVLDYSKFAVILPSVVAAQQSVVSTGPGYLVEYLRSFPQKKWEGMYRRLKEVKRHFTYGHPALPDGAEDMIWQAVSRKVRGTSSTAIRQKRARQFAADLKASGLDTEKKKRGRWATRLERLMEKEKKEREARKETGKDEDADSSDNNRRRL